MGSALVALDGGRGLRDASRNEIRLDCSFLIGSQINLRSEVLLPSQSDSHVVLASRDHHGPPKAAKLLGRSAP